MAQNVKYASFLGQDHENVHCKLPEANAYPVDSDSQSEEKSHVVRPNTGVIHVYGTTLSQSDRSEQLPSFVDNREQELLDIFSLGQSLSKVAMLDTLSILVFCYFSFYWILLSWGPICGIYGAMNFNVKLVYLYLFYYAIRITIDIAFVFILFRWWAFLLLFIHIFIMNFVCVFAEKLYSVTEEELELLQHPFEIWGHARPFFYVI